MWIRHRVLLLLALAAMALAGCSGARPRASRVSRGPEACRIHREDVRLFDYMGDEYAILEDTVEREALNTWVGTIRKWAMVLEDGRLIDFASFSRDSDSMSGIAYSFGNVYSLFESGELAVDVDGRFHRAVKSADVSREDQLLHLKRRTTEAEGAYCLDTRDPTMIKAGGNTYRITQEVLPEAERGGYLGAVADSVTFESESRRVLPREDLAAVDWHASGCSCADRTHWTLGKVYEVADSSVESAIAVEINHVYYRAVNVDDVPPRS